MIETNELPDDKESDQGPDTCKFEPCGTHGCKELKKRGTVFCASCYQGYLEDPEAFK